MYIANFCAKQEHLEISFLFFEGTGERGGKGLGVENLGWGEYTRPEVLYTV